MNLSIKIKAALGAAMLLVLPVVVSAQTAQETEGAAFDVLEYRIDGNSVLPVPAIEEAVYPHLGERKSIKDVEEARDALEQAYRKAGYLTVIVNIPEQKVDAGVVVLEVVEGKVEKLRVSGTHYYSRGRIRERVPALAAGSVPYFPDVQEQLGRLARSADRKIMPVLRPGKSPGKVEVELKVEDRLPLHGSLELSNRYSANTSPLRLSGMVRYDNLWQREHSASLQYQTSPQNVSETKVLTGTYVMPVGDGGNVLALYAVRSDSNIAAVGDVSVIGNGRIYGARAVLPLPAWDDYYHSLTLGLDYKSFRETVQLLGADTVNTPIRYAPLLAQYGGGTQDDDGTMQFNLALNMGVRGLLGNRDEEFLNKRYNALANYLAVRGDIARTWNLGRWLLSGKLDGQYADQPLVSNEQFSAAGGDSVRGYLEGERFGDSGLRGTVELRSPAWEGEGMLDAAQALWFLEGATLRVNDPLPAQAARYTLSSAGVGVRLRAGKQLRADMDYAHPFKDGAQTMRGEGRVHFRLAYEF